MSTSSFPESPARASYDVVIIGGAMLGSATAWFLSDNPDFNGRVLVIEQDPSYAFSATAHTNSCMRQQFSQAINVRCSQFAADYVRNFRAHMGGDDRVPELTIHNFGYMYLADNAAFADVLRASQAVQAATGAGTQLLTADQIADAYPFYHLDDIVLGSHNRVDEGYWDGGAVFDWWRRSARERGVEYVRGEVVAMTRNAAGTRVESVTLKSGAVIGCGQVVNASGPRAARTARMAGLDLPIEPRKRYTYVFTAERPLDRDLPLTIDPSGVHVRQDGPKTYMAGATPDVDPGVEPDDFAMDHALWENKVWPAIANRIPQFEAIRVVTSWVGHYDYNMLDQNAIVGPHDQVSNFFFLNGFSGHGLQQSPAMGRGTAEYLTYGAYRTLDLRPFHHDRVAQGIPFSERAVI
jgi:glycine/D-amino acid oxidase-like deaminating enzyme